jgi:hypothetical protein
MDNTIFNVLYKGLTPQQTWVLPFSTYKKAKDFCEKRIDKMEHLTCKSQWGCIDSNIPDDYRLEDEDGNSHYLVIFMQNIN